MKRSGVGSSSGGGGGVVGRVWVGRLPAVGQLVVVTREAAAAAAAATTPTAGGVGGGAPLVLLGGREGRHLLVRRPRPGEAVQLFDGRGALATATVVQASRHQATLRVLSSTTTTTTSTSASTRSEQHADGEDDDDYGGGGGEADELESLRAATRGEECSSSSSIIGIKEGTGPTLQQAEREKGAGEGPRQGQGQRRLTVAVAMPKGSRADWVVEKLTEVGAHRVQPLLATKSVLLPGDGRLQRWRQMALESSKQSLRLHIPEIAPPVSVAQFVRDLEHQGGGLASATLLWGCMPEDVAAPPAPLFSFLAAHRPAQEVVLLVGPEGDFTNAEKELLRKAGAFGVSLGPNRLRVETAALVLATATSLAWFH